MPDFFEQPVLNSPYEAPARHWELDGERLPTGNIEERRRPVTFMSPVPPPRRGGGQRPMVFDEGQGLSSEDQQYELSARIEELRGLVGAWRRLPRQSWQVTPETARLLDHWRRHEFRDFRPFFCQVEAVETLIWLTEVAPKRGDRRTRELLRALERASEDANAGLWRLALKLATGAGKTAVMAMIIAWQTINAVRHPGSQRFTRGFLVVTPGITIRDRLRVLQPHDPDSYYSERELAPPDFLDALGQARIVITNYHAFRRREREALPKGSRALLEGREGPTGAFTETEGEMLQRVMPELMGLRHVLVLNDEAHHCYRERPGANGSAGNGGDADEREEALRNSEAARLWISGIEAVQRRLGLRRPARSADGGEAPSERVQRVVDLSATPFFLRGSGYAEGALFPWTACDFSLVDAIECGIVKLPRVPVSDNVPGDEMPVYRELWRHIGKEMPHGSRRGPVKTDPLSLPAKLKTALDMLYGHYETTFRMWHAAAGAGDAPPPCFIVVCNSTATSKLVADYIAGFEREDGGFEEGRLPLFANFDEEGNRLPRMHTLLIDSRQLESGDALDQGFRKAAAVEIERFRKERLARPGQHGPLSDEDLLREVMNTVGKPDRLGGGIRCVVSVGMLTEGWDANTVTHVLGVRAFSTQLLCEQVVGRALRRQSYDLNEEGLFDVEYADVLGVPFDFTAKPVVVKPKPPRKTVRVRAVRPDRDALEIRFPRVDGYHLELPEDIAEAAFTADSRFELTKDMIGPTETDLHGMAGAGVRFDLRHTGGQEREQRVAYEIVSRLLTRWPEAGVATRQHLFLQLRAIVGRWMADYLVCRDGAYPAQLLHSEGLMDTACERIAAAIALRTNGGATILARLSPYSPQGTTMDVDFDTSRKLLWTSDPRLSHVNIAVCDSEWEREFCRVIEEHPRVLAYARNEGLGFEAPYRSGGEQRRYRPDFIVRIDDGRGAGDPLHLVAEIKGIRRETDKDKQTAMRTYWIPGVNNLGSWGRWAFEEFSDPDPAVVNRKIDAVAGAQA